MKSSEVQEMSSKPANMRSGYEFGCDDDITFDLTKVEHKQSTVGVSSSSSPSSSL